MRLLALCISFVTCACAFWTPTFAAEHSDTSRIPSIAEKTRTELSPEDKGIGRRPRIGLALGGGGTRGAAHLGVLRVLEENHIPIDFVCGTSIGSVVGGLYASGVPISRMEQMIRDQSLVHAYIRTPIALQLAMIPFEILPRGFGKHGLIGFASGEKFRRFIDKQLPENKRQIEDTKIPFAAVTTDLETGNPYVLKEGSISQALEASSAVPFLKRPVRINGKVLNDGFVCGSNLPAKECREMGADVVICVNIDGPLEKISEQRLHHNRSFRHRITTIILSRLDAENGKDADVMICPDVTDVGLLSKRGTEMDRAIQAGAFAAEAALPDIKALLNNERSWRANVSH